MGEPALRIYPGADEQPCTLREAFEQHLLPDLLVERKAAATIGDYRTVLSHWERWCYSTGIGNTGAHAITDAMLRDFRSWAEEEGYAASTINKWRAKLRSIFLRLGPRGPGNPRGAGLIDHVPYMPSAPGTRARKRIVTHEELDAVWCSCEVAQWPRHPHVPTRCVWQCLVVLLFNYGLRTWDLVELPSGCVHLSAHSPDPDSIAENQHGWLAYVPRKTARRKPDPLVLPLNGVSRAHIDRVLGDRPRLFPWGARANSSLYGQWGVILQASGVEPFRLSDLRKTCNTAYERIRHGIGRWILGHAPRGVNEAFYLNVEHLVIEAVHNLPQPPAFLRVFDEMGGRQLPLF